MYMLLPSIVFMFVHSRVKGEFLS